MSTISLNAHYDGEKIVLDEPFSLPVNTPLIVTIFAKAEVAREAAEWYALSALSLSRCYGEDEPDYD